MEDLAIQKWPPTLRTQLSYSGSHKPLFEVIGSSKAFIGIFELFSRTPLPKGTAPVMARISEIGLAELDRKMGLPGDSKTLRGYSILVVSRAIDELAKNDRNANSVRRLIHECMHEALKLEGLVHDITTAARTLARLNLSSRQLAAQPDPKTFPGGRNLKNDFEFESLTDRPQDWRSSHWWTGE